MSFRLLTTYVMEFVHFAWKSHCGALFGCYDHLTKIVHCISFRHCDPKKTFRSQRFRDIITSIAFSLFLGTCDKRISDYKRKIAILKKY